MTTPQTDKPAQAHTPTPWRAVPYSGQDDRFDIEGRNARFVGTIGHKGWPESMGDAALIVRAVNSHDKLVAQNAALVEALRYIVEWHPDPLTPKPSSGWNAETARDLARAALALCGEE